MLSVRTDFVHYLMSVLMIYKQDRPERPEKFPFIEIIN